MNGYTKLVFFNDLAKEAGWESLHDRRRKHKLILYFKIVEGLSPNTLSSLVPQSVVSTSTCGLRGSQNYRIPQCRTALYKKNLFFPQLLTTKMNYLSKYGTKTHYPVLKGILIEINPVPISCT